jgi:hypothetical protein
MDRGEDVLRRSPCSELKSGCIAFSTVRKCQLTQLLVRVINNLARQHAFLLVPSRHDVHFWTDALTSWRRRSW